MGFVNLKSINPIPYAKKKAEELLKPIIVKHTESGCKTCGGGR